MLHRFRVRIDGILFPDNTIRIKTSVGAAGVASHTQGGGWMGWGQAKPITGRHLGRAMIRGLVGQPG